MLACKPVTVLVNVPVPVPSEVLLLLIVGPVVVLQHTPRAVIGDPPSDVIVPPAMAAVVAIPLGVVVVRLTMTVSGVMNATSLPYTVPLAFVAYALR